MKRWMIVLLMLLSTGLSAQNRKWHWPYGGFLLFDKPIYHQGDTLRMKAYVLSPKGRPFTQPVTLTVNPFNGKQILNQKIRPYRKGLYEYEIVLQDTTQWPLDELYYASLEVRHRKAVFFKAKREIFGEGFIYDRDIPTKSMNNPKWVNDFRYLQFKQNINQDHPVEVPHAPHPLSVTTSGPLDFTGRSSALLPVSVTDDKGNPVPQADLTVFVYSGVHVRRPKPETPYTQQSAIAAPSPKSSLPPEKEVAPFSNRMIRGMVHDTAGQPVPGATIVHRYYPDKGDYCRADGSFRLAADSGAVLQVRSIGYVSQWLKISDKDFYDIAMEKANTSLDTLTVTANLPYRILHVNDDPMEDSRAVKRKKALYWKKRKYPERVTYHYDLASWQIQLRTDTSGKAMVPVNLPKGYDKRAFIRILAIDDQQRNGVLALDDVLH